MVIQKSKKKITVKKQQRKKAEGVLGPFSTTYLKISHKNVSPNDKFFPKLLVIIMSEGAVNSGGQGVEKKG
jgi:hypothetical protein